MERAATVRRYRMLVMGGVGERLASALGCRVEVVPGGSILVGDYVDQAHLTGLINRLHDLHVPIRSVEVLEEAS